MYFLKQIHQLIAFCLYSQAISQGPLLEQNPDIQEQISAKKDDIDKYKDAKWYTEFSEPEKTEFDNLVGTNREKLEAIISSLDLYEGEIKFSKIQSAVFEQALNSIGEYPEEDEGEVNNIQSKFEKYSTMIAEDTRAIQEIKDLVSQSIFEKKLWQLGPESKTADFEALIEEFGRDNIFDWVQDTQSNLEIGKEKGDISPEQEKGMTQKISTLQKVLGKVDQRNFENMDELQSMNESDFLSQVPQNDRIQYFSQQPLQGEKISSGQEIDITFTFQGVYNRELSSLTAGEILPTHVSKVTSGDIVYVRKGLTGEFFSEDVSSDKPRLMLKEGDRLKIGEEKSLDDITALRQEVQTSIVDVPETYKDIAQTFAEKGLPVPAETELKIINDINPAPGDGKRGAAIEQAATDIAEMSTRNDVSGTIESLKGEGLLRKIYSMLLQFLKSGGALKDENGVPVSSADYISGMGISPEDLEKYGNTGGQFAHWLSVNKPVYEGQPFYCGKNVGEAMNDFGFKGLPTSGRNGADWATICKRRPDQFKKLEVSAEQAPPGSLISYKRNTGGSEPRQKHGHIEVALGGGRYYFGKITNSPGGSRRNPPLGTYEVFMPISKTPKVRG